MRTMGGYKTWLNNLICLETHARYKSVIDLLSRLDFTYLLELDENRARDGLNIREEFYGYSFSPSGASSVLEVLIGLARHGADLLYDPNQDPDEELCLFFWEMIDNLGLNPNKSDRAMRHIIQTWLDRGFDPDGVGSPFPLGVSEKDQCEVEIWYQLQSYILQRL